MTTTETVVEPLFDPNDVGQSVDALIPVRASWLSGWQVGDTLSRRRGSGFEIDGTHDYQAGDDPRHIDWALTARDPNQWPQVRDHYSDITPSLWVVTDLAQERYKANAGYFSEQQLALSAVMTLLKIANYQGMPSAILVAGEEKIIKPYEAPRINHRHLYKTAHLLADLVTAESFQAAENNRRLLRRRKSNSTDIEPTRKDEKPTLTTALRCMSRLSVQSVVAVVSDFRHVADPDEAADGWYSSLRELSRKGHDILAIELTNPWDVGMPEGADRFRLGSGTVRLDGKSGREIRDHYAALAAKQQLRIEESFQRANAKHIRLSTDEPSWLTSLRSQLSDEPTSNAA